jgi:hypothetical protein
VDWDHPDIKSHGYYYATFDEVTIQCYDPPPGASVKGSKSYIYTGPAGTSDTVQITDKDTVLKSFLGSGTDLDADYASASGSGSSKPTDINVIPGLNGAGPGTNGQRPADSPAGSSPTSGAPSPGGTGFFFKEAAGLKAGRMVLHPKTNKY